MYSKPVAWKGAHCCGYGPYTCTLIKNLMMIGMVQNHTTPHTIPDALTLKKILNLSQCTTKTANDVCHVQTLIRLKCEKYNVIKLKVLISDMVWYGM